MAGSRPTRVSRRDFVKTIAATAAGATLAGMLGRSALAAAQAAASAGKKKPNVLLILADDLGYETLGCDGGTSYKTPNIDKLAQGGIRFENCFCTPLCSPSRVQLMTGQYGFRTGWTRLISGPQQFIDPSAVRTFGHVFKDAGYATAIAGKWQLADFAAHPDNVARCGFDQYCMWSWMYGGKKRDRYWNPHIFQNGKVLENTAGRYGDDIYSQFLIDFMKSSSQKGQPFFAYYPMCLVHAPFHLPPNAGTAAEFTSEEGKGPQKGAASGSAPIASAPTTAAAAAARTERLRKAQREFPSMMEYADTVVGRLVEAIDKLGIREDTIIIFTGDNGTDQPVTSMMGGKAVKGGKGTLTDRGTHVPLVVNWKGTSPQGKVHDDMVDFSDVMPTLCDLAGAKQPAVKIDGVSFAPRVLGKDGPKREWVFSQLGNNKFVRTSRWKLHSDGRLYDVRKDPDEASPIPPDSRDTEAIAARAKLQAVMDELQ